MKEYIAAGVIFKQAGKIYDFIYEGDALKVNDMVVIEADKGEDIARVVVVPRNIQTDDNVAMKKIIRKADKDDLERNKQNVLDEPKAFGECKKLVMESALEMKLLAAEYSLDKTKLTFYFTSEGRVDFRQLVRDLARIFRTRIEMRQIGVRDATKMIGGFGLCGREFCCSCFLRRFDNISIKMAKNQNLILNPNKISGVCGRLMCCLLFEKDRYCDCQCGEGENAENDAEFIELNEEDARLGGDDKK